MPSPVVPWQCLIHRSIISINKTMHTGIVIGRAVPAVDKHRRLRLRAAHGKVLLLGVTHARNTFIHSVEEVLNVPNRLTDKPMQMTVVDEAGAQHTVYMRRHYNAQQPHISEDFVKLEQAYLDCGAARNTKFGDARCILCDAEGLFRVTRHVLAPNPEAFVTEPVIPPERWQGEIL